MLVFMMFLIPFLLCILWLYLDSKYEWDTTIGAIVLSCIFSVCFIITCINLALGPSNTRSDIQEFIAVKNTVVQQRNDTLSSLERLSLTQTIIDSNKWLAKEQYWAKSLWLNWFYDKAILKLTPIK